MNTVIFETKVEKKDLYQFLMRHFYTSFSGIFGVVLSLGAFALFIMGIGKREPLQLVIFLVMASLFTIVQPLQMQMKAAKQVKSNPVFQNPLKYTVETDGISVSQKEDSVKIAWEDIRKIVETKHAFYLYMTVLNANVIPKQQIIGSEAGLKEMIQTHMDKSRYKLQ